jgi:hypothetical protein
MLLKNMTCKHEPTDKTMSVLEFQAYTPMLDGCYADIAKWESYECAHAAAQAFEFGDPRFLPYMQAMESLIFMGHFAPEKV